MFRLGSQAPSWLTLLPAAGGRPAVEVQFAPIGIKAVRAAHRAVRAAFGVDPEDNEEAGDAFSRALIRIGIVDWRGIGDADGQPLEVSAEAVELFLAHPDTFDAADRLYVMPWVQRDAEGNVSAGSPSGTSAEATPAPDIASSPAMPSATGDASPTQSPGKAAAPTSSTKPRPKKAKRSST